MKATQITIDDMNIYKNKIIYNPLDAKLITLYNSFINSHSQITNSSIFDVELTSHIFEILLLLSKKNNYNFIVSTVPIIIMFYVDNDEIIRSNEIEVKTKTYEYVDDNHLETIFNDIFLNKKILLNSLYVINDDNKKIICMRYEILFKNYLSLNGLNLNEIEEIYDDNSLQKIENNNMPDFGNYVGNKIKDIITNTGHTKISHNENKYKEMNKYE